MKFRVGDLIFDERLESYGVVFAIEDECYCIHWLKRNTIGRPPIKIFDDPRGPWGAGPWTDSSMSIDAVPDPKTLRIQLKWRDKP